jgi:hypothetical protein
MPAEQSWERIPIPRGLLASMKSVYLGEQRLHRDRSTPLGTSEAMKRRHYGVTVFTIVTLIASCVWVMRVQPDAQAGVTVALVATNSFPRQASFRVFNDSPRAIFLSWTVVEEKTASGWRMADKREPKDPRVVGSGKSMDLVVPVPAQNTRWRLKIIYGTETRGPELLLTKVQLGIEHRSLSGLGSVGVFTGQSAAIAEVAQ